MTNETQPFDQWTYDQLIARRPVVSKSAPKQWADGYGSGYVDSAIEAARLAAARTPAPVVGEVSSIEAFMDQMLAANDVDDCEAADPFDRGWANGYRAAIGAIGDLAPDFLAAQAVQVPEIPEGWSLAGVFDIPEDNEYEAILKETEGERVIHEGGATWHEALRAAIEQAKGGQE